MVNSDGSSRFLYLLGPSDEPDDSPPTRFMYDLDWKECFDEVTQSVKPRVGWVHGFGHSPMYSF